jgi:hypothetical protein
MVAFFVYWATAVATAVPILILMAFAVWGRPVSVLEFIAIAGSVGLAVAAAIAVRRPRAARVVARVALIAAWTYWGPALWSAFSNIRGGGSFPAQSFVPAVALLCASLFVLVELKLSRHRSSTHPAPRTLNVLAVGFGVLVVVPLCVVNPNRTPIDFSEMRRVITVSMRWSKRTDVYAKPNHYALEYERQRGTCGTEFWGHPEVSQYIESFGSNPVPVTYEVFFDRNGEAISANFMRLGYWKSSHFEENEGSLSRGGITTGPGMPSIILRNPQDCFDKIPPKR